MSSLLSGLQWIVTVMCANWDYVQKSGHDTLLWTTVYVLNMLHVCTEIGPVSALLKGLSTDPGVSLNRAASPIKKNTSCNLFWENIYLLTFISDAQV